MFGLLFAAVAAVAAALLQSAGLSALPLPLNYLSLPLLLAAGYVATFRPRQAYAAAVAGGITLDLLTSAPSGRNMVVLFVLTAALNWLFRRVFSNLSYPSFAGLTAAGYILLRLLQAAASVLTAPMSGAASQAVWWPDRAAALTMGLVCQTILALVILLAARSVGRTVARRFFITEHVR